MAEADRRLAVQRGSVSWLRAPSSMRATSLRQVTSAVGAGLEDDVGELLGLDQPAEGAQRVLEVLAGGDRRLADLPGGHLHVLLAQDPDHVAGRQVPRLQLVRVEPDAHAVVLLAEGDARRRRPAAGPARP